MKGCAPRLVLKQREKAGLKWPIETLLRTTSWSSVIRTCSENSESVAMANKKIGGFLVMLIVQKQLFGILLGYNIGFLKRILEVPAGSKLFCCWLESPLSSFSLFMFPSSVCHWVPMLVRSCHSCLLTFLYQPLLFAILKP